MTGARRWVARAGASVPPWAILAAGWTWLIIYAYPGLMTQDSFDHLREARDGMYSDAHPPAINLVWRITDYVIAGPFGMLVLQSATLLAGLYLLLRRALPPRGAALAASAIFVFPPVMVTMAVIWKDCLMAGLLALGTAALLSPRRRWRVVGLAAMIAATTLRYNALGATLPLIVLLFEWRPDLHWLKRYPLALAAWLAVTGSASVINGALTDKQMHFWHSSNAVFDIVGTYAHLDAEVPDAELRATLAGTELLIEQGIHAKMRALYSTATFLPILNDQQPLWNLPINGYVPAPPAQRDALGRAWWEVITRHPGAFFAHRLAVMADVLAITHTPAAGAVVRREVKYPEYAHQLGLSTGWSSLQRVLSRVMVWTWTHTPLFTPWIYLALSLLLLPLAFRQRDTLALLLSGVAFEATLLPGAPSSDYRYSHWMVICTLLAAVVVIARRSRPVPRPLDP